MTSSRTCARARYSACAACPRSSSGHGKDGKYQVELLGLDVFDPATMEVDHRQGDDVPAWFLDTDYNGLCFHVCQAFFPRTGAWENLKKALKGDYRRLGLGPLGRHHEPPFEAGERGQIAVKVIDDRGNELLVVKSLRSSRRIATWQVAESRAP